MEQLDIFGKFITTNAPKPKVPQKPKVATRYKASWMDYSGNWYVGEGVSEKQARYRLFEKLESAGFKYPRFAHTSSKVLVETYTIKL